MPPYSPSSQLQALGQGLTVLITVLKGWALRLMLTPAWLAADLMASDCWVREARPEEESRVKDILAPLAILAPHWLAPVPGFWQTSVPPGVIFQPWSLSSFMAAETLKG